MIEIDKAWLARSAKGTAIISAKNMPTVAIATVFQVAVAARVRNSLEWAGGRNVARKWPLVRRLFLSSKTNGLNSAK